MSASTRTDEEDESTILSLTRDATGLMSWAIDSIGDPFAVHGFASDGRHDVQYYRFKDFNESYNDDVKARMAGMKPAVYQRAWAPLCAMPDTISPNSPCKND